MGIEINGRVIESPDEVTSFSQKSLGLPATDIVTLKIYGIKTLANSALKDLVNLEKPVLGSGLEQISNFAISGCAKLSFLKIPATVTYVGRNALADCTNLKCVVSDLTLNRRHGLPEDCKSITHSDWEQILLLVQQSLPNVACKHVLSYLGSEEDLESELFKDVGKENSQPRNNR